METEYFKVSITTSAFKFSSTVFTSFIVVVYNKFIVRLLFSFVKMSYSNLKMVGIHMGLELRV